MTSLIPAEDAVPPPVSGLRRWLRPDFAFVFFLVQVGIGFVRGASQLGDPGIGWHLTAGRLILDGHGIPRVDEFSFTAAGRPWLDYYWLFQLTSAWLERVGGLPLFAAVWLLVSALVPLLLYRWMVRSGASPLAAFLVLPVAQLVFVSHGVARPHVLTYLFFTLVVARLDDVCAGRRAVRALWLLPVIALVWANVHGGFIAGLAAVGIVTLATAAHGLMYRDRADAKRTLAFTIVLAAMGLATVLNPYGVGLHTQAVAHLDLPSTSYFGEFQSPDFRSGALMTRYFELLMLGVLAVGALGAVRLTWPDVGLVLGTLHAALTSLRNMNLFAIVAAPIVARGLTTLGAPWLERTATRWRAIAARQEREAVWRVQVPAACMLVVGLALAGWTPFPTTLDGLFLTPGAVARIADDPSRFARAFNTIDVGGSLTHRFWPAVHVFADDRTVVFGEDFMEDYLTVFFARSGWQAVLDRWGVTAAIVTASAPCATALQTASDWTVDYADDRNVLLVRRRGP